MSRTKHWSWKSTSVETLILPFGPLCKMLKESASYRSYLTTPRRFSLWILCIGTEIWQFWCHVTYVSAPGGCFGDVLDLQSVTFFMKLWLSECLSGASWNHIWSLWINSEHLQDFTHFHHFWQRGRFDDVFRSSGCDIFYEAPTIRMSSWASWNHIWSFWINSEHL